MRLTTKERILLYLLDVGKAVETLEAPSELTQEGVAEGAWVDLRHLTQYVQPLVKEGLVRERRAHVRGIRQRRKVYDLTDAGKMTAVRLRERVKAEVVRVRGEEGVREMPVAKVLEDAHGKASLLDVVRQAVQGGIVEIGRVVEPTRPAYVEMMYDVPRIEEFVGRQRELEMVTGENHHPRIFVVRGVAGIGKSTFGAKACELLRGSRNLFWHRVRSWDTPQSVLAGLGSFLAALGKPGLRAILTRGETDRVPQILRDDLPGTNSFLVFDDGHEANAEVVSLFRFLKDAITTAEDVRALFLTRRAIPFYDRRDVSIHRLVKEIDLAGLGSEEVAALVSADREARILREIGREFGGHPLLLKLIRSTAGAGIPSQVRKDVRRFIEETVYAELSEPERGMVKLASLYRVPVPREALFLDPSWSHDVLLSLSDRSLLMQVGEERFEVHDTVREFFSTVLTSAEQQSFGAFAVEQLRRQAAEARRAGDLPSSIDDLSNALQLPMSDEARIAVRETLGDANERMGDLPDALVAYKEAVKASGDLEVLARLHRKTASALEVRGEMASASEEIEKAFQVLGDRPSVERAWLEVIRCRIAERFEDWPTAREHGQAALNAFRSMGLVSGEAEALMALGKVETTMPESDPSEAEAHLTAALDLAGSAEDPEFKAAVHVALAHLYAYRLGRIEEVTKHLEAADSLLGEATDPHRRRGLLMLKGWVSLKLRADYASATARFQEAAVLGRKIHDAHTIAFARFGLAFAAYYEGRAKEACDAFDKLIPELRALGFDQYVVESLWMVSECCLLRGDVEGFRRAVALLREPQLSQGVEARAVYAHSLEGLDRLIHGDVPAADAAFANAIRSCEKGFEVDAAVPHFLYGVSLRALGREGEAVEHLKRATSLYQAYGLQADLASLEGRERLLTETLRRSRKRP